MVKNPPANAGDTGSTPGLGRSPGEGNGNPLQYSIAAVNNSRGNRSGQKSWSWAASWWWGLAWKGQWCRRGQHLRAGGPGEGVLPVVCEADGGGQKEAWSRLQGKVRSGLCPLAGWELTMKEREGYGVTPRSALGGEEQGSATVLPGASIVLP